MIKRYFSKYTGQQIDEAIGALIENNIQLSDLSESLVAEIKNWDTTAINSALVNYVTITKLTEELCKKADAQHGHDYVPLYGGASVYGWLTFEDGGINAQSIEVNGEPVALQSQIPTKTSDLTNDSSFATINQLFSKNYNDLTNKPTKLSDFTNDQGYISSYTETDPTVPTHVKNITTDDIVAWNNKSNFSGNYNDLSNKPTNVSDFTNDSGFITSSSLPTKTSDLTNDSDFAYAANTIKNYHLTLSGSPYQFGQQILTEYVSGNIVDLTFFVDGWLYCTISTAGDGVGITYQNIGSLPAWGYTTGYIHKDKIETDYSATYVKLQEQRDIKTINSQSIIGSGNINTKDTVANEIKQVFTLGCNEDDLSQEYDFSLEKMTSDTSTIRGIAAGNGYVVACGANNALWYSKDNGVSWTSTTMPASGSQTLTGIAYGNGIFAIVQYITGTTGKIWTTDLPGKEWKEAYYFDGYSLESIRFINNTFVVVGTDGLIMKSDDAANWEKVHDNEKWHEFNPEKDAETKCPSLIDITYGNGQYVASGRNGIILVSINGNTWYDKTDPDFTLQTRALAYAKGKYWRATQVSNGVGGILISTDGIVWNQSPINTTIALNYVRGFAFAGDRIYACAYKNNTIGEIYFYSGGVWDVAYHSDVARFWCSASNADKIFVGGDGGNMASLDLDINWEEEIPYNSSYYYYKNIIKLNNGSTIESDVYLHREKGKSTPDRKSVV